MTEKIPRSNMKKDAKKIEFTQGNCQELYLSNLRLLDANQISNGMMDATTQCDIIGTNMGLVRLVSELPPTTYTKEYMRSYLKNGLNWHSTLRYQFPALEQNKFFMDWNSIKKDTE